MRFLAWLCCGGGLRTEDLSSQSHGAFPPKVQPQQDNYDPQPHHTALISSVFVDAENSPPSVSSAPSEFSTLQSKLYVPFRDLTFHALIGKGSFKQVYRGKWNNTNVAIVAMRRGGLVTEARLMQQLGSHPNLVQFYRWSSDQHGNEYMVVELVPFGPLDRVLGQFGRQLRNRAKLAMAEQIAHAMSELAAEGVLHRDLAARNILVQSMQPVHVKVSDFGLARVRPPQEVAAAAGGGAGCNNCDPGCAGRVVLVSDDDGEQGQREQEPRRRCRGGELGGGGGGGGGEGGGGSLVPVRWSAPEVLRIAGGWSEKSDVYSYGVTMWEIFSNGAEPYASRSDAQAASAILAGDLLPRPDDCPHPVYALMQDCWRQNPAQRPTFRQIVGLFRRWREMTLGAKAKAAYVGGSAAAALAAQPTRAPPGSGCAFGRAAGAAAASVGGACDSYVTVTSLRQSAPTQPVESSASGGNGGGYVSVASLNQQPSSPTLVGPAGADAVGTGSSPHRLPAISSGEVLQVAGHHPQPRPRPRQDQQQQPQQAAASNLSAAAATPETQAAATRYHTAIAAIADGASNNKSSDSGAAVKTHIESPALRAPRDCTRTLRQPPSQHQQLAAAVEADAGPDARVAGASLQSMHDSVSSAPYMGTYLDPCGGGTAAGWRRPSPGDPRLPHGNSFSLLEQTAPSPRINLATAAAAAAVPMAAPATATAAAACTAADAARLSSGQEFRSRGLLEAPAVPMPLSDQLTQPLCSENPTCGRELGLSCEVFAAAYGPGLGEDTQSDFDSIADDGGGTAAASGRPKAAPRHAGTMKDLAEYVMATAMPGQDSVDEQGSGAGACYVSLGVGNCLVAAAAPAGHLQRTERQQQQYRQECCAQPQAPPPPLCGPARLAQFRRRSEGLAEEVSSACRGSPWEQIARRSHGNAPRARRAPPQRHQTAGTGPTLMAAVTSTTPRPSPGHLAASSTGGTAAAAAPAGLNWASSGVAGDPLLPYYHSATEAALPGNNEGGVSECSFGSYGGSADATGRPIAAYAAGCGRCGCGRATTEHPLSGQRPATRDEKEMRLMRLAVAASLLDGGSSSRSISGRQPAVASAAAGIRHSRTYGSTGSRDPARGMRQAMLAVGGSSDPAGAATAAATSTVFAGGVAAAEGAASLYRSNMVVALMTSHLASFGGLPGWGLCETCMLSMEAETTIEPILSVTSTGMSSAFGRGLARDGGNAAAAAVTATCLSGSSLVAGQPPSPSSSSAAVVAATLAALRVPPRVSGLGTRAASATSERALESSSGLERSPPSSPVGADLFKTCNREVATMLSRTHTLLDAPKAPAIYDGSLPAACHATSPAADSTFAAEAASRLPLPPGQRMHVQSPSFGVFLAPTAAAAAASPAADAPAAALGKAAAAADAASIPLFGPMGRPVAATPEAAKGRGPAARSPYVSIRLA